MKALSVTAKNGKEEGSPSATISINVPETATEAIQLFGDQAVLSNAVANWVITVQSAIRRDLKVGKTAEDIQAHLGSVKMGVAADRTVDPKAAFMAAFSGMSPEDKAAMIKQLQQAARG
jgi:hypothetical protein